MQHPLSVDVPGPEETAALARWYARVVCIYGMLALLTVAVAAINRAPVRSAATTGAACVPAGFEFHGESPAGNRAADCVASAKSL